MYGRRAGSTSGTLYAMAFDPDAPALPGSGIFGLPDTRQDARVVLIPVPFDATTSYGGGTSAGPRAVRQASAQVDLYDGQFGRVYRHGIHMLDAPGWLTTLNRKARTAAVPIIRKAGPDPKSRKDRESVSLVDKACAKVADHTHDLAWGILAEGKIPGLIGGDHSTPLGAIRACAEYVARHQASRPAGALNGEHDRGLGILHIDAHMDFRPAFEGFAMSHASIMYNVLQQIPEVTRLVQVGIRDFGEFEFDFGRSQGERVSTHYDLVWTERMLDGAKFTRLCKDALAPLPSHVYVSFDIDGLDPALCPHTGTPVPGGLSFNQTAILLQMLADSGRRVVGFDLVEVCPGPSRTEPEWDANVGARVLYKLCGCACASVPLPEAEV